MRSFQKKKSQGLCTFEEIQIYRKNRIRSKRLLVLTTKNQGIGQCLVLKNAIELKPRQFFTCHLWNMREVLVYCRKNEIFFAHFHFLGLFKHK
jgi:hypothetical protein